MKISLVCIKRKNKEDLQQRHANTKIDTSNLNNNLERNHLSIVLLSECGKKTYFLS